VFFSLSPTSEACPPSTTCKFNHVWLQFLLVLQLSSTTFLRFFHGPPKPIRACRLLSDFSLSSGWWTTEKHRILIYQIHVSILCGMWGINTWASQRIPRCVYQLMFARACHSFAFALSWEFEIIIILNFELIQAIFGSQNLAAKGHSLRNLSRLVRRWHDEIILVDLFAVWRF
jgi:hypothetical protein